LYPPLLSIIYFSLSSTLPLSYQPRPSSALRFTINPGSGEALYALKWGSVAGLVVWNSLPDSVVSASRHHFFTHLNINSKYFCFDVAFLLILFVIVVVISIY